MNTSIGKMVTEVVPAPESPESTQGAPGSDLARVRRELARAEGLAERLRAEGFDD